MHAGSGGAGPSQGSGTCGSAVGEEDDIMIVLSDSE